MKANGNDSRPGRAAQWLADRQQRHAVQAGLREGDHRTRATRSRPTRAFRTGTTPRPARSSSRCSPRPTASSSASTAANDGLGGAVASVLKRNGATKDIPTTGQDATDEGLQRVLLGSQCMTVYKAIKKEADAASQAGDRAGQGRHGGRRRAGDRHGGGHRDQAAGQVACCSSRRRSSRRTSRTSSRTASPPRTRSAPREALEEGLRGERRQRMSKRFRGTAAQPLLSLRGVNKSFGAVHVLRDVDFDVSPGRSHRPRGGQRRRQEHADQVRRGDPPVRLRRDGLRGLAGHDPRSEGRQRARDRDRLSGPRAVRQPRRRAQHVPRA